MSAPPTPFQPSLFSASLAVVTAFGAAALSAALVSGCGDPLMTAQDRGDTVFGLRGKAIFPEAAVVSPVSAEEYEVAVIFILVRAGVASTAKPDVLEVEVVKGTIEGEFPANFRVELTDAPRVYPFDISIGHANRNGTLNTGLFDPNHAPDGVRIGHLAIGPAAEIAALPSQIFLNISEDLMIGKALALHLPNTTVTPYQVLYAEGVSSDDVVYPQGGIGTPVTGGMSIGEGFTLIDARQYFAGTMWQECANQVVIDSYARPEFEACVAANAPLIDCLDRCFGQPFGTQCRASCYASYPTLIDANGCLDQVSQPYIDAICGPEITPDPTKQRILHPFEPLTVKLGTDDVKGGMWILHAQTPEAPP